SRAMSCSLSPSSSALPFSNRTSFPRGRGWNSPAVSSNFSARGELSRLPTIRTTKPFCYWSFSAAPGCRTKRRSRCAPHTPDSLLLILLLAPLAQEPAHEHQLTDVIGIVIGNQ